MISSRRVKCSLCHGNAPVGPLYENLTSNSKQTSHETNASLFFLPSPPRLPPLTPSSSSPSLSARTGRKFEKLSRSIQSVCGSGSGPGLAWLPGPPPVLLAQWIETQPSRPRHWNSFGLFCRSASDNRTPHDLHHHIRACGKYKLHHYSLMLSLLIVENAKLFSVCAWFW